MLNQKLIKLYREANVYDLLLSTEPHKWSQRGNYIRSNNSPIVIKNDGTCFYNDSTKTISRNAIDILSRYMQMRFADTVAYIKANAKIKYPTESEILYEYLVSERGISMETVKKLINQGLINAEFESSYINITFSNSDKKLEFIGTSGRPFKRRLNCRDYWSFGNQSASKIYITESAIDALSLYELIHDDNALYISVGGESNRIYLIKEIAAKYKDRTITIAVDNDDEGNTIFNALTTTLPRLERIIPQNKDWNDDLLKLKQVEKEAA